MKIRFLIVMIFVLLLTGCWDRRELNELGIISAFGIDKDSETGGYILSSQMVRPETLKKDGNSAKSPIEIVTTKGNTIFEAIRNITKKFDRRAYFAHINVIVIDEQLAKEGILPSLDYFSRDHETRKLAWLIIAKGTTAREILGVKKGIEDIQGNYLRDIIEKKPLNSEVSVSNLLDFFIIASGDEKNPITGVMEIQEESNLPAEEKKGLITEGIILTGTAVFKKDKLVGYLNDKETRGLNWITGKVESGIINFPSPAEKDKLIVSEIKRASSSIKPEIKDGKISFTIEVKEEGYIDEQHDNANYFEDLEFLGKAEKEQNKIIEKEIKMTVEKLQKGLGSDILGFGSAFSKKYPKKWKSIKDDWENIFPEVAYEVKVDGKLTRLGLTEKPINSNKD